jgi:hypothetical protein
MNWGMKNWDRESDVVLKSQRFSFKETLTILKSVKVIQPSVFENTFERGSLRIKARRVYHSKGESFQAF